MCFYVLHLQVDEDVIKDCIPLVEIDHTRVSGSNGEDQLIESLTGKEALGNEDDSISGPKQEKSFKLSKTASVRALVSSSKSKLPPIEDDSFIMEIHTRLEGYNSGKTYFLLHTDKDILATWCDKIAELSLICKKEEAAIAMTTFERIQQRVAVVYKVRFCLQSPPPIACAEDNTWN